MKRFAYGFFGLALVITARCYSPDLSGVHYSCFEANPSCPDGLTCIAGECLPPGSAPTPDGGVGDGMMGVAGCKSGVGTPVGTMPGTVFACPGLFNTTNGDAPPPADQLCGTNYKLCTDASDVDQNVCKTLTGFFAAQVAVKRTGGGTSPLGCGMSNSAPFFGGCGRNTPHIVDFNTGQNCNGFTQALDCIGETNWACNNQSNLTGVNNGNAGDGVLCCKM